MGLVPPDPPARPLAAALQYQQGRDRAPRITAAGRGAVAERILALAEAHDIPLHRDGALIQLLLQVPVGHEVPVELYEVIAELLAAIYRAEASRAESLG